MTLAFKTKTLLAVLSVLIIALTAALPASTVYSQNIKGNLCGGSDLSINAGSCEEGRLTPDGKCVNAEGNQIDASNCQSESRLNNLIENIVNVLSVIVGIVAVIMIIIGGFKYITSGGDSGSITSAKHTIIYAIVGLIIVALAQIIVRFVLNQAT